MCKGFPFVTSHNLRQADFETDPECTFMKAIKKKSGVFHEFAHCESIDARRVSQGILGAYILGNRKIRTWVYDLRTEKWDKMFIG